MISYPRRSRRRRIVVPRIAALTTTALAGAGIPALGLMAGPASAAPNPDCTGTVDVTCVFAATGGATQWKVPFGVTSLTVIADGASGADASSTFVTGGGSRGAGGEYDATLTGIRFPTTLTIDPGRAARGPRGGSNGAGGGGDSGRDSHGNTGGGGGGASIVAISPASLSSVLLVAGGGGGGSAENEATDTPGDGGTGGGSSNPSGTDGGTGTASTTNGKGGTPTMGGAGGSGPSGGCTTPAAGTRLNGGNGQTNPGRLITCGYAGGGGGSGWFGGGGGGTGGGGGGGSAFPAGTRTVQGVVVTPQADTDTNLGDGEVTIEYTAVVNTTRLMVWSERTGLSFTLYARLTANGQPVPSEPISFSTGVVQWCTGEITSSSGIASCSLTPYESALLRSQFGVFSAYFGGDVPGALPPATGYGVAR